MSNQFLIHNILLFIFGCITAVDLIIICGILITVFGFILTIKDKIQGYKFLRKNKNDRFKS